MKFLKCLILISISFGTFASQGETKGNYFKDRNAYLVCIFVPKDRGGVTSYHHFWNGTFARNGEPSDKHYSFATMTPSNKVLNSTTTKLNYIFYEWGLESDETSECKRKIETNYDGEEYLSRLTDCPAGETMFTIPTNEDINKKIYSNRNENIMYTGDNKEILSISLGFSDTWDLGKYNDTNLLKISRISLRPINVGIDQPCTKISKDFFIQQKKDFYKKREEDNKRIKDEFAL
jgi:hypothetical protein